MADKAVCLQYVSQKTGELRNWLLRARTGDSGWIQKHFVLQLESLNVVFDGPDELAMLFELEAVENGRDNEYDREKYSNEEQKEDESAGVVFT